MYNYASFFYNFIKYVRLYRHNILIKSSKLINIFYELYIIIIYILINVINFIVKKIIIAIYFNI